MRSFQRHSISPSSEQSPKKIGVWKSWHNKEEGQLTRWRPFQACGNRGEFFHHRSLVSMTPPHSKYILPSSLSVTSLTLKVIFWLPPPSERDWPLRYRDRINKIIVVQKRTLSVKASFPIQENNLGIPSTCFSGIGLEVYQSFPPSRTSSQTEYIRPVRSLILKAGFWSQWRHKQL